MSKLLQDQCRNKVEDAYRLCEKHYNRKFPRVKVAFSNRMTSSAGYAIWDTSGQPSEIRLSNPIMVTNGASFVYDTPGHEAAHIIAWFLYGDDIRPHGPEWAGVMQVIGLKPEVTHSYKTSTVTRKFAYRSKCGAAKELTIIRHNKLQREKVQYYRWPKDGVKVYKDDFVSEVKK